MDPALTVPVDPVCNAVAVGMEGDPAGHGAVVDDQLK